MDTRKHFLGLVMLGALVLAAPVPAVSQGSYVGVSLALEFGTAVGGVSGFTIVPAELARSYGHNAPLPPGSVQGLAWETSRTAVALATNRDNKLITGKRYVVFLSWPRETIPVAILDLPGASGDYSTTLPATLDGASVLARLSGQPVSPPVSTLPTPPGVDPPAPPGHGSPGSKPCNPDLPKIWQPGCVPAESAGGAPPREPQAKPEPSSASPCDPNIPRYAQPGCREVGIATPSASSAPPASSAGKCHPNIPRYSQPGCVE